MPIYLVRWPDSSAALVKAGSEDELIDTLDEIANPDACTWSVYRGPLFLEFTARLHDLSTRLLVHQIAKLQELFAGRLPGAQMLKASLPEPVLGIHDPGRRLGELQPTECWLAAGVGDEVLDRARRNQGPPGVLFRRALGVLAILVAGLLDRRDLLRVLLYHLLQVAPSVGLEVAGHDALGPLAVALPGACIIRC